jgi:shikimate dehydrogenase
VKRQTGIPARRKVRRSTKATTGSTRIVGIFGDPVAHSRSPAMHNAAFAALGLDCSYVAFHVVPDQLANAVHSIRSLDLLGVNVTVPHKERAARMLDSVSPLARQVGAVNTIVNRDGHLFGDNTDVYGFVQSLRSTGVRLRGKRAMVVGAGGTARSVLLGLSELGVGQILLVNRTAARSRKLTRQLAAHCPPIDRYPLSALENPELLARLSLIVNATSLGWQGEHFPPLRFKATPTTCLCFDMAYGRETDFLRRSKLAGRRTVDGIEMLLHQGARSFTLWTGRRPPLRAMRMALSGEKS